MIEQGALVQQRKIAELLRNIIADAVEHECPPPVVVEPIVGYNAKGALPAAIHILHEQAHGPVPFRTCREVPCMALTFLDLRGPAPLSVPLAVSA